MYYKNRWDTNHDTDDTEDLDLIMQMYSLIEYSSDYSGTTTLSN